MDDDLLKRAKAAAAHSGRTLTRFIEDALRQSLAAAPSATGVEPYRVRTFASAVQPGVDLDDSAGLLELMESD